MLPKIIIGKKYEAVACNYLKDYGYKIIVQNYTCPLGEIDIICQDGDTLVFVEVKYSQTKKFGLPIERINSHKIFKLKTVAQFYLKINKQLERKCRFDAVEIVDNDVRHIKNII